MIGNLTLAQYKLVLGLSSGLPEITTGQSVGTFLCFLKLPLRNQLSVTTSLTREIIVTRLSTEVDATTGSIPGPEEVFRTRHIEKKRWAMQNYWERQFQRPFTSYTFDFSWIAGLTTVSEARKRYSDPFLPPFEAGVVTETQTVPDAYSILSATPTTTDGRELDEQGRFNTDPEWIFFPVVIQTGQSLRFELKKYDEQAVRHNGTYFDGPYLDDSVPAAGPSGSEFPVSTFAGEVWFETWLLRV